MSTTLAGADLAVMNAEAAVLTLQTLEEKGKRIAELEAAIWACYDFSVEYGTDCNHSVHQRLAARIIGAEIRRQLGILGL